MVAHTVESRWRETRREALTALADALDETLQHVDDVEAALAGTGDTVVTDEDPIVVAGRAYTALIKSRVRELRAEADQLGAT